MIESVWQAIKKRFSGERAKDYTARLWQHAKWNSFHTMRKTADDFGEGINPHPFCSILATSLGRSDVANRFSAHSVLANTPRVSAKAMITALRPQRLAWQSPC